MLFRSNRVGIGNTSPSWLLDLLGSAPRIRVKDSSTGAAFSHFENNSGNFFIGTDNSTGGSLSAGNYARVIWSQGAYPLVFGTNDTQRAQIDSSGRLLLGTSTGSGNNLLHIAKSANSADVGLIVQNSGTSNNTASIYLNKGAGTEADYRIQNGTDGSLTFSYGTDEASFTERTRITSGGSVLIADTALRDGFTSQSLQVTGFSLFYQTSGGTAASVFTHTTSGTQTVCLFRQGTPGITCGSITVNSATSTSYNTSSDYRLKENIVPLTGAIDRIKQLKPSQFNFIVNPTKTVDGFLAHEAQAVVPECVTGAKDEVDDNGDPVYQGIDQSKLVPLLTAALQEAIGRIETLEAEVAALKAK